MWRENCTKQEVCYNSTTASFGCHLAIVMPSPLKWRGHIMMTDQVPLCPGVLWFCAVLQAWLRISITLAWDPIYLPSESTHVWAGSFATASSLGFVWWSCNNFTHFYNLAMVYFFHYSSFNSLLKLFLYINFSLF